MTYEPVHPAEKSDYRYIFETAGYPDTKPVLVITDLNMGGMSVTNNIEAILDKIAADEGTYFSRRPAGGRSSTATAKATTTA